jgi:hypothetical protein
MIDSQPSSARRFGLGFVVAVSVFAAGLGAVITRAATAEASGACPEQVVSAEAAPHASAPAVADGAMHGADGAHVAEAGEPILTDEAAMLAASRPELPEGVRATKLDHENFLAELRAQPSYVAGKEQRFGVVVTAKGDFKINPQFPVKFKLADAPEGLSYPKPLLKREDGKFEDKSGSFEVPFVASKAGRYKLGGTLSLSVCSDKRCLMEKVALDHEIDVQ